MSTTATFNYREFLSLNNLTNSQIAKQFNLTITEVSYNTETQESTVSISGAKKDITALFAYEF